MGRGLPCKGSPTRGREVCSLGLRLRSPSGGPFDSGLPEIQGLYPVDISSKSRHTGMDSGRTAGKDGGHPAQLKLTSYIKPAVAPSPVSLSLEDPCGITEDPRAQRLQYAPDGGASPGGRFVVDPPARVRPHLDALLRPPLNLVRGEGVWLYDADGSRYLDAYNNMCHQSGIAPPTSSKSSSPASSLNTHTRYLYDIVYAYCRKSCSRPCSSRQQYSLYLHGKREY